MHSSQKKRRVFIGIKLKSELAEACAQIQQGFADLPARLTRPEDMHLTLVPPFDMADQGPVEAAIKVPLEGMGPFMLTLRKLDFGPTPRKPRLAWIVCDPVDDLVVLRQKLVDTFEYEDRYSFRPHVTMARFKDKDRHLLKKRSIEKHLDLSMEVRSVELFESVHRGDVTYKILASIPFPVERET